MYVRLYGQTCWTTIPSLLFARYVQKRVFEFFGVDRIAEKYLAMAKQSLEAKGSV